MHRVTVLEWVKHSAIDIFSMSHLTITTQTALENKGSFSNLNIPSLRRVPSDLHGHSVNTMTLHFNCVMCYTALILCT
jgi:hypothetical protein